MKMLKRCLIVSLILCGPGLLVSFSQLSGPKTIGGSSPDYTSIADAVTALVAQGISGPVVFNIRAGTYTEQVTIPEITGASRTNTITFQSENLEPDSVLIQHTAEASGDNYIFKLDGTDHLILPYLIGSGVTIK